MDLEGDLPRILLYPCCGVKGHLLYFLYHNWPNLYPSMYEEKPILLGTKPPQSFKKSSTTWESC